ncbi:hypothetical protein [Moritella sp. F3]|uniref:hypothetical protein n=1 Tax=Moritella sp. F3 TaxID=2718882 RepID=UPI0018E124F4|nr:hypothetical protein [Moritella sp. F3]GIC79414.1 hypothetical protein FMO001_41410 [Moritella sp. F1]GIC80350.1 hypothetical protein FMO003_06310 [Moritella sp. F3]
MSQQQSASEVEKIAQIIRSSFAKSNSTMLAQAYFDGNVIDDGENTALLEMLTKNGLIRPSEEDGTYMLAINLKRILDKLLLRHASYRKRTDIAKVMQHIDGDIKSYKRALLTGQHNEVAFYLSQVDEELYGIVYELEDSVSGLFAAITSKFGFVDSLESKIHENEKAIAYTEGLLNALADINLNDVYAWLDWDDVPAELSRKVTFFIDGYRRINRQLEGAVHRMRQLLMTLRKQNEQVARLKAMSKYLKDNPIWELDDYDEREHIPTIFNRVAPLPLSASVDISNQVQQEELTDIYNTLRKESKSDAETVDLRSSGRIDDLQQKARELEADYVLSQCEALFKQVLSNKGDSFSALHYWQQDGQLTDILPQHLWLSILYNEYHKCAPAVRKVMVIDFPDALTTDLPGSILVSGNLRVSDIQLQRA